MRIVVAIKQTFTTEARITLEDGRISDAGMKFIVNPYDEFAVEEAIKLREAGTAEEAVVVTVGPPKADNALRQCLAMGADQAFRVWDDSLAGAACAHDVHGRLMAGALEKLKPWGLLMSGKLAVDDGLAVVVSRAAEILGIPQISVVNKMEIEGDKVVAVREMDGFQQVVEATLPALVTADKSLNTPRYPTLPNIMKAKKKPLTVWTAEEVGTEIGTPTVERVEITLPPAKGGAEIIGGDPAEAAGKLAEILHNDVKVF